MTLTNTLGATQKDVVDTPQVLTQDASTTQTVTSSEQEVPEQNQANVSFDELPESWQTEIKSLRQENASRRVENKELNTRIANIEAMIQNIGPVSRTPDVNQSDTQLEDSQVDPSSSQQESAFNLEDFVGQWQSEQQRLQTENTRLRVVQETGLQYEVISSLNGESYENLLQQANSIKNLLSSSGDASPAEVQESQQPATNKPPKVPSGSSTPAVTDAQRKQTYFGSGVNTGSGVFNKTPGNLNQY